MRRAILLGAGAALAILALVGGFRVVRSLSFFQVRRLELVGGRYLTAAAVARELAIPARTSVFDDLAPRVRTVRAIPGVLTVSVI